MGNPDSNPKPTTGIVIVDHGSRRAASNEMLERFVRVFADRYASSFPVVEPAHMELAEPSIATAFDRCVERGATRVAVCPYFLAPGKHWHQDIPNLARDAALKHPDVAYAVTAPIGLSPMIQDVIASQLDYCLGQIDGAHEECEWCRGTGRCAMKLGEQTEEVVFDG
ncbi:MAG: CbiX/SirB N-terminal domain-containing protein [Planctomycetota bacterium]